MATTLRSTPSSHSQNDERSARLQTVRRLYFYLVALVSSTAGLVAISGLLGAIADTWLGPASQLTLGGNDYLRRAIAFDAGLLVVTAPLFLLHWRAIGATLDQPGEREAGMRKFFLYVASAIALGVLAVQSAHLIEGLARLALGEPPAQSSIWPSEWLHDLGLSIVAGLLLFYWQWVLRQDGDFGAEEGSALIWRQIYLGGVLITGLALLIFGSAGLIDALLQRLLGRGMPVIGGAWFAGAAAAGIAQLLVGAVLARTAWQVWQAIVHRSPDEEATVLRRLTLYVAVIGGTLATLIPATLVLRRLLLWAFAGFDADASAVLVDLIAPLSFLPSGILVWGRFAAVLRDLEVAEAAREGADGAGLPDTGAAATVRRIYHYAVAATGLVLLWIGAGTIVQVLLDRLLTASVVGERIWEQPLATGLSLVAVGAPVWALHWRNVQRVARLESAAGAAERASLPRRTYLYAVSLAGALVILYFLAQVLYRLFLVLLGETSTPFLGPELAEDLARTTIAAILWGVHLAALRADTRLAGDAPTTGDAPQVSLAQRRATLEQEIAESEAALARLRAALAALDDTHTAE